MKHLFPAAALLAVVAGSVHAQTAYLDFGDRNNGTMTGTVNNVTYNTLAVDPGVGGTEQAPLSLNGAAATTDPVLLVDTDNNQTAWGFEVDKTNNNGTLDDNGGMWGGPYPTELSGVEPDALARHWFANRGARLFLSFSGLDDNETYNLLFYAGSQQTPALSDTNGIISLEPVTGSGTDFANESLNTFFNETDVITWDGVSPDGGVIAFNFISGSREGWLNFMWIEQVGGLIGDFDGDGDVDGVDIAEMFSNFNGPGGGAPTNPATDLDSDGDVDGVDIAALFGAFTGPSSPASVPEPSGLVLLGLGSIMLTARFRSSCSFNRDQ